MSPAGDSGGAIFAVDGTITVLNSTIAGNVATGAGGGIVVYRHEENLVTSFTLRNTIISNNGDQECIPENGVTSVGSGNLIMKNSGCPGVVASADPILGLLTLNPPGNTPTMAIDNTSPAYNAADGSTSLSQDQRGVPRPQQSGFDIGAYEWIKPSADLAISKTTVGEPYAGQYFSWIIDVENQGPTDAVPVTITDTMPAGVTFSSITGSGGFQCTTSTTGNTTTVTCTKSVTQGEITTPVPMTAGEIDSLTLTGFIPASITAGTQLTNSATISSPTSDPNRANNTASVTATVKALADLSITKSGPSAPVAGTNVTYTITATNLGPSDAQTVSLSDALPANFTSGGITALSAGWSCAAGPPQTCSKSTFAAGSSASFTVVAHLSPSATQGAQLCNTASISTTTTDPVSSNNSSQSCGTIQTSADLGLTQGVTFSGTSGKGTATFTLGLRNYGVSDSQNVSLVANSSLFSMYPPTVTATGATCSIAQANVTCTWPSIPLSAPTRTAVITVSWRSAVGQVCDAAVVSAGTSDPNSTNNSSTVCTPKLVKR